MEPSLGFRAGVPMAMKKFRSVEEYLDHLDPWQSEVRRLRDVLLSTGLEESLKWSAPCYSHEGKNVCGIGAFKSYFGVWFFQGALLEDPEGYLINAQEGKTKALRQWRMSSAREIRVRPLKRMVAQAVDLVGQGKEIRPRRNLPLQVDPVLQRALQSDAALGKQFKALTPGRQREYAEYIAEAKQEATKLRRLEKIIPLVLQGAGLHDRYRC